MRPATKTPGPVAADIPSPAELARAADALFADAPPMERRFLRLRPYICPFAPVLAHIPRGSRVLDVGCGAGLMLALAAGQNLLDTAPGRASVGFDAAKNAIDLAKAAAKRAGLEGRVDFLHLPVERPWPQDRFDVVSIVDVLHHIPRPHKRAVIEEAARHVAPGGRLLYKDMSGAGLRGLANSLHDLLRAKQWVTYTPTADVESWATAAGLRLVASRDESRLWYGHQLRVFERPAG